MAFTRLELKKAVAESPKVIHWSFTANQITTAIHRFFSLITQNLIKGTDITIYKVGTFKIKNKNQRVVANFNRGNVVIPPRRLVKFRAARKLSQLTNQGSKSERE